MFVADAGGLCIHHARLRTGDDRLRFRPELLEYDFLLEKSTEENPENRSAGRGDIDCRRGRSRVVMPPLYFFRMAVPVGRRRVFYGDLPRGCSAVPPDPFADRGNVAEEKIIDGERLTTDEPWF